MAGQTRYWHSFDETADLLTRTPAGRAFKALLEFASRGFGAKRERAAKLASVMFTCLPKTSDSLFQIRARAGPSPA